MSDFLLSAVFAAACLLAAHASEMPALGDDWPKAIHYRYANNFSTKEGEEAAYAFWMKNFGTIMGAELDFRVTLAYPDRIPVIRRVKREHPDQFLAYYQTGHIATATDALARKFSSGHWAYYPPVRVMGDVRQEAGETTLRVVAARSAPPATGAYVDEDWGGNLAEGSFGFGGGRGDDICLYSLKADGTPDWENAEHVLLLSMDEKAGTITVRRGQYGSEPRAFSGKVFAAPHIQVTKFHGWRYNFHPDCPRDAEGRQAVDIWVEEYARPVLPGGVAEHFDALQLDTMVEDVWHGGRGMDLNNDQQPDPPSEMSKFAAGVADAMRKLQEALRPHGKLLLPDGANRGFLYVNGWEVEGFPGRHDPDWRYYSEVVNRLMLSNQLCAKPRFTMVQHKIFNYQLSQLTDDGKMVMLRENTLPFHLSRAVMALTTAYDGALTWYSIPPQDPDGANAVYDEMRMGVEGRRGWLGKVAGSRLFPALTEERRVATLAQASPPKIEESTSRPGEPVTSVSFATFRSPFPELTVVTRIAGEPRRDLGVEAAMPRGIKVKLEGGERFPGYLIPGDLKKVRTGILRADGEVEFLGHGSGLTAGWVQDYDSITVEAASGHGVERFWEVECEVPEGARLDLRAFGKEPMRVEAAPIAPEENPGDFVEVIPPFVQAGPAFFRRSADLAPLGLVGKRAVFRMISRGPAVWAQVAVAKPDAGGNLPAGPVRVGVMGFVPAELTRQEYHFNHVPVGAPLKLSLAIEGDGPVRIEEASVYAAQPAVAREYERGVVLANVSPRPFTFDLAKLFPGQSLRRLRATSTQDTATNNGEPAGQKLTLGPFDGLFLVKDPVPSPQTLPD